ncbi:MAG: GNAT family N-acetyltransferase [Catenulispora sp.]|nr:GNAT family N-acetyltransferase [Catenulispora sp.]
MALESADDLSWRPLLVSDAEHVAELLNADAAADDGEENYSAEDAAEELADPNIDLERGSVAAFDGDLLVGYLTVMVRPLATAEHRVWADGTVRPTHRGRGVGGRLLREGIELARAAHERVHPNLKLIIDVERPDHVEDARALYTSLGFQPVRYFQLMRHPLGAATTDVPSPAGMTLESWSPDNDAEFHLIRNESFRDHWGSTPVTAEAWQARYTNRSMRPDLSFLLRDADSAAPAAMVLTFCWDADTEATGVRDAHLMVIGTMRDYRRRGLAGALIGRALRAAEEQGYDRASLSVDSANPNGAFGLYEKAGFVPHKRRTRWALEA